MTEIPRDASGRVIRPRPSQLLMDVMDKLGPDHLTTRTLMAALIERDRGAGVEPRAVTPTFGWHLPVLADPPNVPYDLQENSLDVEATVGQHDTAITANTADTAAMEALWAQLGLAGKKVQHGSNVVTLGGVQAAVPYPVPFAAKPYPVAMLGDSSGAAVAIRIIDASSSAGQFVFQLLNSSGAALSTGTFRVNWIAIGTASAATTKPAPGPEVEPL